MNRTVGDVMTEAVVHIEPAAPLTRALQLMVNLKARSFPVVAPDGHLVGIIAREDLMRALQEATRGGSRG
jgi:CBS domain-containing protein